MMKGGAAPALAPGFEFSLVVLKGEDQGAVYRLTGQKITIGRGQENAIQFPNDMKCSRHHAVIEFNENGIEIENVSDSNHVFVDNKEIHRARIKHGSVIIIGETKLQLNVKTPSAAALGPVGAGGGLATRPDGSPVPGPEFGNHATDNTFSPSKQKKGGGLFKILVVGLGLLFVYLMTSTPTKKKDAAEIRTDEAVEAEIEKANKLREAAIAKKNKAGENSQQFESAQTAYVRGFRDYKQGNFGRPPRPFRPAYPSFQIMFFVTATLA